MFSVFTGAVVVTEREPQATTGVRDRRVASKVCFDDASATGQTRERFVELVPLNTAGRHSVEAHDVSKAVGGSHSTALTFGKTGIDASTVFEFLWLETVLLRTVTTFDIHKAGENNVVDTSRVSNIVDQFVERERGRIHEFVNDLHTGEVGRYLNQESFTTGENNFTRASDLSAGDEN